ncbi:hypothetical protein T15_0541 [Streptococcus suis T15]|nr:hypothetical protein T15_0541 [Streptococcus suis T15]
MLWMSMVRRFVHLLLNSTVAGTISAGSFSFDETANRKRK